MELVLITTILLLIKLYLKRIAGDILLMRRARGIQSIKDFQSSRANRKVRKAAKSF